MTFRLPQYSVYTTSASCINLIAFCVSSHPYKSDENAVNLQHMLQAQDGLIAEMSQNCIKNYHDIIDINPNATPSGINRTEFDAWRKQYWTNRAGGSYRLLFFPG
ncbi:HNH/ENDO VII family nuclease [Cronobacter turicensis]|uniref:HNH/ENDO VII family nuclease n=1 Tax=Cronobacter turicensis TaxID=413502 RepID=UPI000CFDD49C